MDGGRGVTLDPANEFNEQSNEPPQPIDYVFVGESYGRPLDAGRVMNASLAFHERRTGTFASDHYGLSVEIGWPTPTRPPIPDRRRT